MLRHLLLLASFVGLLVAAGCVSPSGDRPPLMVFPDMDFQPKYRPQGESPLFADRRAARPPVPGTVATDAPVEIDDPYYSGRSGDMYVGKLPVPVTRELLLRGQERFNIYCAPCHDRTGQGKGIVPSRTTGWLPTDLTGPAVYEMPDGEIFNVITHGRRTMPPYAAQIPVADRWAIVAYVRVLQRARRGTVQDVPADIRTELR